MTPDTKTEHPAAFPRYILDALQQLVPDLLPDPAGDELPTLLDPFGGIGRVHLLADERHVKVDTLAVELEPEWATQHPRTIVGDATNLDLVDCSVQIVVTSPCYGNRMADHHDARDDSERKTYAHKLGRMPSEGSAAVLRYGKEYRQLHERAIREMIRVLEPGAPIVINMKNHVETVAGKQVEHQVVEWWINALLCNYCSVVEVRAVPAPGLRFGANYDARVDTEKLIVVTTPLDRRLL